MHSPLVSRTKATPFLVLHPMLAAAVLCAGVHAYGLVCATCMPKVTGCGATHLVCVLVVGGNVKGQCCACGHACGTGPRRGT